MSIVARFERYLPSGGSDLDTLLKLDHFGTIKVTRFGQVVDASESLAHALGYESEEMVDKPLRLFLPRFELGLSADALDDIRELVDQEDGQVEAVTDLGEIITFRAQFIRDRRKTPSGYLLLYNISESLDQKRKLEYQYDLSRALLEDPGEAIIVLGSGGEIEHANPTALRLLSERNGAASDTSVADLVRIRTDSGEQPLAQGLQRLRDAGEGRGEWRGHFTAPQGPLPVQIRATAIRTRDAGDGFLLALRPAGDAEGTAREGDAATQSAWPQTLDQVTRLLNRATFEAGLDDLIQRVRAAKTPLLLVHLDLFDYQEIRESWGAIEADALLVQVAQLWRSLVPPSGLSARLGSDKFALATDDWGGEQPEEFGERILGAFDSRTFELGGKRISVAINLGIVTIDQEVGTPVEAIYAASQACSRARAQGRNRLVIDHNPHVEIEYKRQCLKLVDDIHRAIEEGSFELVTQQIVPVAEDHLPRATQFCEVLLRMQDRDEGTAIPPSEFIPIAEKYGLIADLDRYVIKSVVEKLSEPDARHLVLAVNLSAQSLADESFVDWIVGILDRHPVDSGQLVIEITEASAIRNLDRSRSLIDELHARGCKVALDDFGRSISSFTFLRQLPIDYLKIDIEFIRDMEFSNISHSMVSSINHIGHLLDMQTIAEGVETEAAANLAREIGIDFLQGYFVDKPIPLSDRIQSRD